MTTETSMERSLVHITATPYSGLTRCGLNFNINLIGIIEPPHVEEYRARPDVRICEKCEGRPCQLCGHDEAFQHDGLGNCSQACRVCRGA